MGTAALDRVEKADELLMPVALHAPADHRALQDVQSGKQGRGGVALIGVGARRRPTRLHRRRVLRASEGLDLRLLVDGEHHGMSR
jgi:hypothetical protein